MVGDWEGGGVLAHHHRRPPGHHPQGQEGQEEWNILCQQVRSPREILVRCLLGKWCKGNFDDVMATILEQFCWPKLTKNCLAHPTYRWVVHYCYFEFLNQIWKWLKSRCRKFIVVTIKVEAYSYWLMRLFLRGTDYCGCRGRNDLWWLWDDTCGDYGMHSNIARGDKDRVREDPSSED